MFRLFNKIVGIEVMSPLGSLISITEKSTGIEITPFQSDLHSNLTTLYDKLWNGTFILAIKKDEINDSMEISTDKPARISRNGCTLTVSHRLAIRKPPTSSVSRYSSHFWLRRGWNYLFKHADTIITVCDYLTNITKDKTGRKDIVTIPIGISAEDFKTTKANPLSLNKPNICMIQNHQIKQKSDALLDFVEVIKELSDVSFYISKGLTVNQRNANSKRVISTLSKCKNVFFVEINSSNKYQYLSACDIYVLRSGLDCTPATILEAGLANKPVVASAVGGIPEMIMNGKTGWTIDNKDYPKWVKTITSLLTSPKELRTMGMAHHDNVIKNYEIRTIADKIYEHITN